MSKRVIRGDLSEKGIQSIIDQLRAYKQELPQKAELLCRKLAEAGLVVAKSSIAESPLVKTISVRIDMEPSKAGCKAMLIATGQKKSNDYGTVSTLEFYHPKLTKSFFFTCTPTKLGFPSADVDAIWDGDANVTPTGEIGWAEAIAPTDAE